MADDPQPKAAPNDSLSDLLTRLRTPSVGTSRALQEAAENTARTGRSLSELLTALKPPTLPTTAVPDVQTRVARINPADLPAARTARATEDMVDLLENYQEQVAGLVQALQVQADDQRARAERAEGREQKMHRLAQISAVCTALALLISLAALLVPLVA